MPGEVSDQTTAWERVSEWYGRSGVARACLELQDRHGIDPVAVLACTWAAVEYRTATPLYDACARDGWRSDVVDPLRVVRRGLAPDLSGSALVRRAVADAELSAEREQFRRAVVTINRARETDRNVSSTTIDALATQLAGIVQQSTASDDLLSALATIASAAGPELDPAEIRGAIRQRVADVSDRSPEPDWSTPVHEETSPWNIACLQLASPTNEPLDDRVARVLDEIASVVAEEQPDAVVLPELWTTGFFHFDRYETEAQPIDGEITRALAEVASAHSVWLFGGSFVELGHHQQRHNSSVCFTPEGDLIARYRKIHLFGYESAEARSLTAGTDPIVVATPVGRVGLATCYDLRFPELFRRLVDAEAEVFVVASAWPAARRDHWELLLRARAVENLAWVVACNSAGEQAGTPLAGASAVISPWGEVVATAGAGPEVLRATIDPAITADHRTRFPSLTDRRPLPSALTMH